MSTDDDRDAEDYGNPHAFQATISCECGRQYFAHVTQHDRSYDSPGWVEPEPGEEKCPTCREHDRIGAAVAVKVRAWLVDLGRRGLSLDPEAQP